MPQNRQRTIVFVPTSSVYGRGAQCLGIADGGAVFSRGRFLGLSVDVIGGGNEAKRSARVLYLGTVAAAFSRLSVLMCRQFLTTRSKKNRKGFNMDMTDNGTSSQLPTAWSLVRARLQQSTSPTQFAVWIEPLTLMRLDAERIEIGCPSNFTQEYVNNHFGVAISNGFREFAPDAGPVYFVYVPRPVLVHPNPAASAPIAKPQDISVSGQAGWDSQLAPGSIPPNMTCTFEDFVVGESNQVAYNAAIRAAQLLAEGKMPGFNPLFLHSGTGLGKTHLMHAIYLHVLQNNPKKRILFITAETFMRRFVSAVMGNERSSFQDLLGSVDLLMVDDVQFIARKERTQDEFFHRFHELILQNRQVVMAADRAPANLDGIADRVKQHMQIGMTLEILPTDKDMRLAIIEKKLQRRLAEYPGLECPEDVRSFLAARITSNTRELEGALKRIVYNAGTLGEPITIDLAHKLLSDLLRQCDRKLTVEEIKRTVANYYSMKLADLDSRRRTRTIVRPRQVAMYLAKTLTSRSLPEIGRRFSGKDHTTVLHAVRQIDKLMTGDDQLAKDVENLRRILRDGSSDRGPRDGLM